MSSQRSSDRDAVLLCATDAGGARNLDALHAYLLRRNVEVILITAASCIHLFEPIARYQRVVLDATEWDLEALFDDVRPVAVICGTTRYSSPDRRALSLARARGIRSVAIVDERYGYRRRFADTKDSLADLPDVVALMDEQAWDEAIGEGLPAEACYVTGSPALSRLVTLTEQFRRRPPDLPQYLRDLPRWPIVSFLSETFAADYGDRPGERGPLGPFIGFTEATVFQSVTHIVERTEVPLVLVEKLHPSSSERATARPVLLSSGHYHLRVKAVELWPLLWHSRMAIGMRSMGLLEAHLLRVPAISYQPGRLGPDMCTAVRLGLIPGVTDEASLRAWFDAQLCGARDSLEVTNSRGRFARSDAAERVIALALDHRSAVVRA